MAILLIGTLDTKGNEFAYLREQIRAAGLDALTMNAGVLGEPVFPPEISAESVYQAAGTTLREVRQAGDRGKAIELAARGCASLARQLHQQSRVDGVLALGGSAGTTIATAAMRGLPFGVPKLMVSTMASGQVKQYVGVRDILMMYSVVDISGINRISRQVLTNAAQAMIGMVKGGGWRVASGGKEGRPLITATMFGVTTPCVEAARKRLDAHGYEVLVFHATGTGGMAMESFITDGLITGVLDVTTTELADELVGGVLTAGRDRLTAAAIRGVPQVISVGALDMVNFGPPESVPEKFHGRRIYQHNPTVTLMRTTPEENDKLGKEIAEKASAATGPTKIVVPLRGVSAIDREGQPFWWPEADAALFQSIRNWLSPRVELIEMEMHINDPAYAELLADTLNEMIRSSSARVHIP
jgi:uncharacterized protein (UPF0261 family)